MSNPWWLVVVVMAGCAWVKPQPHSGQVELESLANINLCRKLGEVTSTTLGKVAFVERDRAKVASELMQLARNEAQVMGGDTIAALSDIQAGEQRFGVYRCRDQALPPP